MEINSLINGSQDLQKAVFFDDLSMEIAMFTGKDTMAFLNRISTIKPQILEMQEGSLGFILSSKGDVKVAFELFRREQGFLIQVNRSAKAQFQEMIEYYHFSEDIKLEFLEKQFVGIYGQCAIQALNDLGFNQLPPSQFPLSFYENEKQIIIQNKRLGVTGFDLWLNPHAKANLLQKQQHLDTVSEHCHLSEIKALTKHDFEGLRKKQGLASFPQEYRYIPLEISKNGITEGKGCYPGQEVIERIIALGKPAKEVICLSYLKSAAEQPLKSSTDLSIFQQIDDQDQLVGEVLDIWENEQLALLSVRVKPNLSMHQRFHDAQQRIFTYLRHFGSSSKS